MNVCKTDCIPCPYALVEWNELPCFATQDECDNWRKKVKTLPFEDPTITLSQFVKQADSMFASGSETLTVAEVYKQIQLRKEG